MDHELEVDFDQRALHVMSFGNHERMKIVSLASVLIVLAGYASLDLMTRYRGDQNWLRLEVGIAHRYAVDETIQSDN
jgi:hypothetical protein